MSHNDLPYDLVVFGATGFVGKILCQYLIDQAETEGDLSWAIAGRSRSKLETLVASLGLKATHLPMLIADVNDQSTLQALCAQTSVIISTVGPYALYGEPLVKVCAETGTDYCDLTGEFQWIRRMVESYEALAQQSGARLVHCCGFDSIPSDLGVYFLQQQAQIRLGQPCVRVKMRVKAAQGGVSGGTVASGINLAKEAIENPGLRKELTNPYSLCPEPNPNTQHPPTLIDVQYDDSFQEWVTPFVMAEMNTRIVLRSNALLNHAYGTGFQYDEAILTGQSVMGWIAAQGLNIGLNSFFLAALLPPTRWVLETWVVPAPGDGPSTEAQEQGFYDLRFWGETADGQTIQTKVMGDRDPGYGSTAKMLAQAGICLAKDVPKSEKEGGFWTPSTLFGERLIERLVAHSGLSFNVLS
ncbi:MAG: saccharopine dehydrogenase NADP-binding domain-containing protein [Cyanobacteria bacterium P01_E01_bin.6]